MRCARLACGCALLRTIAFRGKREWLTLRNQMTSGGAATRKINPSLTMPSDGPDLRHRHGHSASETAQGRPQGRQRDPLRECRPAIWNGAGDPPRHLLPYPRALVPVPERAVRRRQDDAAQAAVPVAQADARPDHHLRQGPLAHLAPGTAADAPPHRRGVPGFPPARPHDDLRERRAAAAGCAGATRRATAPT